MVVNAVMNDGELEIFGICRRIWWSWFEHFGWVDFSRRRIYDILIPYLPHALPSSTPSFLSTSPSCHVPFNLPSPFPQLGLKSTNSPSTTFPRSHSLPSPRFRHFTLSTSPSPRPFPPVPI